MMTQLHLSFEMFYAILAPWVNINPVFISHVRHLTQRCIALNITVVGMGRWGSCIAWYCSSVRKLNVTLYGLAGSPEYIKFRSERRNEYLVLPDEIQITDDLALAVKRSDHIIISVPAQRFRGFLRELKDNREIASSVDLKKKTFILCMKGIECDTGSRLTEVFHSEMGSTSNVAIWVGPGHVQDFYAGRPSCMVISSEDIELTKDLVDIFNSSLIRFYYSDDLLGCEIGAAAKNVMGIAAGMLDGINCPGLKGALMARGAREVSRLIRAMGGNELTAYGLSHLGDYQATLFSEYSQNRLYGENFIRGIRSAKLAEGVDTSKAMVRLSGIYNVELPISKAVYSMIFEHEDPDHALTAMFDRANKFEFE